MFVPSKLGRLNGFGHLRFQKFSEPHTLVVRYRKNPHCQQTRNSKRWLLSELGKVESQGSFFLLQRPA